MRALCKTLHDPQLPSYFFPPRCLRQAPRARLGCQNSAKSGLGASSRQFSECPLRHQRPARPPAPAGSRTPYSCSTSRSSLQGPGALRTAQTRSISTEKEKAARTRLGPTSIWSFLILACTGGGFWYYVQYEKQRVERKRIAEHSKGHGRPKVGGPFELLDQDGNTFSSAEKMNGRFSLVYFGFSHCPDICPEELDKMAAMLDIVARALPPSSPKNPDLLPVFITCDPARDTPGVLKKYLAEFHPEIVGLTGTWEQIKQLCRLYRVYFSTPPGVQPGQDYLVDHSIYFYLMDPEGDFVEAIGRQHTAEKAAKMITEHMSDWKGKIVKSQGSAPNV